VIAKAQKVQRYLDMGHTWDEAAIEFGVTTQSIANWLKLLELSPMVKDAISSGKIRASAGAALHGFTFEEQNATLNKLLGMGAKPTTRNVKKQCDDRPVAPPKRLLNKLVDVRRSQKYVETSFFDGVRYALGLVKPDRVPGLNALIREIESEKKKPQKKAK